MKGFALFLLFLAISLQATYAQKAEDTTRVKKFLAASRQFQWKDSYKSLSFADSAYALAKSLHINRYIASAENLRGFCFWTFGDNDLAIQSALEALNLSSLENQKLLQAESYYILARAYMDVGETFRAHESIRKSELLAKEMINGELLCSIYNLKGVIYYIDNNKDSALLFYNKALDLGKELSVPRINLPRIISNIGECYSDDPNKAFNYFNEALALANETDNQIAKASITGIIGHNYIKQGDLIKGEKYLQDALAIAQKLGLRRVIRHTYSGLVTIRLKQNKGNEAVSFLQKYYAVRDSLVNGSKIRQIVELESKHALELKEQNIKLLESEKQIQALWKNLFIILSVFLIIAFVTIYVWQQYRHKKNKEMLNLEIDYLTQRHKETIENFKASLGGGLNEPLETQDQKVLRTAIAIAEQYIADPQFTVEKMAEEINMSRTNLHRKIKSITGLPPSELIRTIRLKKAARLLAAKADTATQIALQVGFDDYSHFSKVFKKHFGVSPNAYSSEISSSISLTKSLDR